MVAPGPAGGATPDPDTGYAGPPPTGIYRYPAVPYPPAPYPPGPYPAAPYGMYPGGPADPRPAAVTAAAVIGWVVAGLLVLAAGLLFFGAAFLHAFDAVNGTRTGAYVAEFSADAVVDIVAAGLLVAGGVSLTNRSAAARGLHTAGAVVVLVATVYWLVRWGDRSGGAIVGYAVVFGAGAAVALALTWTGAAGQWLTGHRT